MQTHLNPLLTYANNPLAKASHMVKPNINVIGKYILPMRKDIALLHAKGLDVLHL